MSSVGVPYEPDFGFPWAALESALSEPTRLCIICNPNNPTSTIVAAEPLLELARRHPNTLFIIDEIYTTYTGVTVLPQGAERDNLIALHSLSKSCGIAALRVGFACGAAPLLDRLRRVTGPYDVNQFGVVAALAVLDDWVAVEGYCAEVASAKQATLVSLDQLGIRYYSGGGNYLLVWPERDVVQVEMALRARGILVRSMHGKPMLDHCFRLSVGTRQQMQHFSNVFAEVLHGLAPNAGS